MTKQADVVIEVIGEGRTELGLTGADVEPAEPVPPNEGVLPILVHALCDKPSAMRVRRKCYAALQGKTRSQKVQFAKRQSLYNNSSGIVFVLDSEGELRDRKRELMDGRDREYPEYPMAVGIAHPCIEAWILADASAIRRALDLPNTPEVPEKPESLPAPAKDRKHNPKIVLSDIVGGRRDEIDSKEKDKIAKAMNDMVLVRERCPHGFAPFAEEVIQHIKPLFQEPCSPA